MHFHHFIRRQTFFLCVDLSIGSQMKLSLTDRDHVNHSPQITAFRKFNVLLSAYSCEPLRGTEAGHGWNWAYELARLGHNVFVITRPVGRQGIEAFLARFPCPNLHFTYVDSPHYTLRFGAIRPILECLPWQRSALAAARKLCAANRIDVVHHVTWGSIHVGSKLWKLRKPFVFGPVGGGQTAQWRFRRHLRGGWHLEMLRSLTVHYLTGVFFNARSTLSHANLVLVANSETHRWASRLGARWVEYMLDTGIPNAMLVNEAKPEVPVGALRILWVGRLVPRKALLLALEALSKISPSIDVSCTILGDGPQGRYVRDWIAQLNLSERVTWLGQLGWEAAMQVYENHDVLLFTSLRDTGGTQLIEAMGKGLPIVTLDHHGAHVAVPPEAGIKIPVTTPERTVREIAQALECLARQPATVRQMAEAAKQCASMHTWDRKATAASQRYSAVVAQFAGRI
jgi:glycosyltransferase involved in cell wall biosynthesis